MSSNTTYWRNGRLSPDAPCDEDQLERLRGCSDGEDISDWNEWRRENREKEVWLCGANLRDVHLEGANLRDAHLEGADLRKAHLEGANLTLACLDNIAAWRCWLEGATLKGASIRSAHFFRATVDARTYLWACVFDRATDFTGVPLGTAQVDPKLRQALKANIREKEWRDWFKRTDNSWGVRILRRVFDKPKRVAGEVANSETHFKGESPKLVRLLRPVLGEPRRLQGTGKLKREELNWTDWYGFSIGDWAGALLRNAFVRPFWCISDYARSTGRILLTFFLLGVVFGVHYWGNPGCLEGLDDVPDSPYALRELAYGLYFSIVTMTTLGFGDIHASALSLWGQAVLSAQVILGYVLLGALVTRFAVLFSGGGPAAKLAPKWKPPKPKAGRKDERDEGEQRSV